jgi:DNA-binding beta-propeller fold protein YncE
MPGAEKQDATHLLLPTLSLKISLVVAGRRWSGMSTRWATEKFTEEDMFARSIGFVSAMIFTTALVLAQGSSGYRVLITYKVGGTGRWDSLALDSQARRLYISRGTHVMVLDPDSGKRIGDIANTPGVHGIALAPELGLGFTSNGDDGTVSVFDIKTLTTRKKVKVGDNPGAILYDSATKRVFTFNLGSQDSTAIDGASGAVLGSIKLDSVPYVAASDDNGKIFVNVGKGQLVTLDPNRLEVKARWPLAPCVVPTGLSMDRKNRRLFVGCDNNMMAVVDADSGRVVETLAIGDDVGSTGFDAGSGLAFASCADGSLTVVREDPPDRFTVIDNVRTMQGAHTMALDAITHRVFLATAQHGKPPDAKEDDERPNQILPDSFVLLVVGK